MTRLSDVYEGGVGTATGLRRRLLGAGLFALGAGMVVGAIPVATTDLAAEFGLGVFEARELAGVLAGFGLPAAFLGIFTVLPAGRITRATAVIGASLAVLGVAMFTVAYPYQWLANAPALAGATAVVYSSGTLVTFWCLFVGLATFKRRNDPGGTARVEITDEGTVRVVTGESDRTLPGFGSVGLFGNDPEGNVRTQTGRDTDAVDERADAADDPGVGTEDATILEDSSDDSGTSSAGSEVTPGQPTPASDGAGGIQAAGSSTGADSQQASAEVRAAVDRRGQPDEYCGNCRHFQYVRADGDMAPYCGFHDGLLSDMDACEQWESNS